MASRCHPDFERGGEGGHDARLTLDGMGRGSGTDGVEAAEGGEELEEEEPAPLHSLQILVPKPCAPRAASERQLPVVNCWSTLEPKDIVRDLVELGIVHYLEVASNLKHANNKFKENNF